jgi:hypothetical protein
MLGWLVIRPCGLLMLGAGIITLPTPLPIGAILIVCGLVLLLSVSRSTVRSVLTLRRDAPRFDTMMAMAEHKMAQRKIGVWGKIGLRAARILRKTRPARLPQRFFGSIEPMNS